MADIALDRDRRPVVIVDAFSRGAVLARMFSAYAPCLHVRSRPEMPEIFVRTFQRALFQDDLDATRLGMDALVATLRARSPAAVVAGSEFGIELADALSSTLGLPTNGVLLSAARRDKFEMANAVARRDVSVPARLKARELAPALDWFRQHGRPVVVKPVDSSGSDNVFICHDSADIEHAWQSIFGHTNIMMRENRSVLLQEYLLGDEYAINTVSCSGVHWFTDVWRYTKRVVAGGRRIYDRDDLLDPACAEVALIAPYVRSVLDALGIAYGPAHTEVFIERSGPQLVETAARIVGNVNPPVMKVATGTDQVEMTVWCYMDPARMKDFPSIYERKKHVCCVNMIVHGEGRLDCAGFEAFLSTLPSFWDVRFRVEDGSAVQTTTDMSSSPGTFFLTHDDQGQIEQDYARFRDWELGCYAAAGRSEPAR